MIKIDLLNNETSESMIWQGVVKLGPSSLLEHAQIHDPVLFGRDCIFRRSEMGRYSGVGQLFSAVDTVLGPFCAIGDNVTLNAGQHPISWLTNCLFRSGSDWDWHNPTKDAGLEIEPFRWRQSCTIGADVWIGNNVLVKTGVQIGHGAIIGANSVVTGDVPPYAIMGGVPAKLIRMRFSEPIIERLLRTAWWDRDISVIRSLPLRDIDKCLEILEC